ncbi:MAG: response regulator [bacterium]
MKEKKLLVIEDDENHRYMLKRTLEEEGYMVLLAPNGEEGIRLAKDKGPQVILLDIIMDTSDEGMRVLSEIKKFAPEMEVIMLTAVNNISTAVKAMKDGAFNYITKPFSNEALRVVIEKAFQYHAMKAELDRKIIELENLFLITEKFVTEELGLEEVLHLINKLEHLFKCDGGVLLLIRDSKAIIKSCLKVSEKKEKDVIEKSIELKSSDLKLLQDGKIKMIRDIKIGDPLYPLSKELKLIKESQTLLLIPLKVGNKLIGFINIYTTKEHEVLREDIPFIQKIATHLAIFVQYIESVREVKRLETEAELGKLSGGIVHEISPLIMPLEEYIKTKNLQEITRIKERLKMIVDELRNYTKGRRELNLLPCRINTINELLEEALTQYWGKMSENKIKPPKLPDIPTKEDIEINIDKGKIGMVFSNLISNAIDAIKIKNIQEGILRITVSIAEDKRKIFISFEDNGCGIREDEREKIFDLFVTSKKETGMGLGLSSCKTIMKKHKGDIFVEWTKIGEGSKISVELPIELPIKAGNNLS